MANARLRKSGQHTSYHAHDDGATEMGVEEQSFTDNSNGTITDVASGLIWLKYGYALDVMTWDAALTAVALLADSGCYGLADSSSAGDWRVPNLLELQSLVDVGSVGPSLVSGHPFVNVMNDLYWTSTTVPSITERAYAVSLLDGQVTNDLKTAVHYLLPVRGS